MKKSTNESDSEGKWMYLVGTQSADFLNNTIEEENTYDMPFIKGHYEDEHTFIELCALILIIIHLMEMRYQNILYGI